MATAFHTTSLRAAPAEIVSHFKTIGMENNRPLGTKKADGLSRFLAAKTPKNWPKALTLAEIVEMHHAKRNGKAKYNINWFKDTMPEIEEMVRDGNYNPFSIHATHLLLDLLTDSGTSTYTDFQNAMIGTWGDIIPDVWTNAYGGLVPRIELDRIIAEFFGESLTFDPTLQGRAAEFLLLQSLIENGLLPKGSTALTQRPFDTTKGHINKALKTDENDGVETVVICNPVTTPQVYGTSSEIFLGNMPMDVLRQKYIEHADKAKIVLMTVTDNGGGGQPVSMKNIREVAQFAHGKGMLLWIDACRIFENAEYIHLYEEGYRDKSILEIAREMLSHADVATVSFKKMYSHSGGAVLLNRNSDLLKKKIDALQNTIRERTTIFYGNGWSYCGLTGKKMVEIIASLLTAIDPERIAKRLMQTHMAYWALREYNVPAVGGAHALYLAADQMLPNVAAEKCPAELLQAIIATLGTRGCALGERLYGKWGNDNGGWQLKMAQGMDTLRYAIPRETYDNEILISMMSVIGKAYSQGVFGKLEGGLVVHDFNTRGFYHFGAKYSLENGNEFAKAVSDLLEIMYQVFNWRPDKK